MDDANARRVHAWIDSYIQAWNSNDPADIRALWVIRLDAEGRCAEFAEWWMRHPAPDEPAGLSDPP